MTEEKDLSPQAARALNKWQALKRRYGHEAAQEAEAEVPVLAEEAVVDVLAVHDDVPMLTEVVDSVEHVPLYTVTAEQLALLVQAEVQRVLQQQPQWVYEAWLLALHQRVQEQGLEQPPD